MASLLASSYLLELVNQELNRGGAGGPHPVWVVVAHEELFLRSVWLQMVVLLRIEVLFSSIFLFAGVIMD